MSKTRNFKIIRSGDYFFIKPLTDIGKRHIVHWFPITGGPVFAERNAASVAVAVLELMIENLKGGKNNVTYEASNES